MKSKFYPVILMVLAILTFTACDEMISEVEPPKTASQKLVVTSFISPESDFLTVTVSKTRMIYETRPANEYGHKPVEDAIVTISDGINTVQLPYNEATLNYKVSQQLLPVVEGRTYYLNVTAPGGFVATSSCTVPDKLPPAIEIDQIDTADYDFYQIFYTIYFKFRDIPGEGDYYGVYVGRQSEDGPWSENPQQSAIYSEGFDRGETFVSDKNIDGQYFTYKTYEMFLNNSETTFNFTLCLTDIHYYKYHKAVWSQSDDNPFAEPYPIYSNVDGALGVFCAYRSRIVEF
jgi:hypothetical protein